MQPKHILVVDDNEPVRYMLRTILEQSGHFVVAAGNGEEACGLFESADFDVVVADMGMPHGNGLHVLRHVKRLNPEAIVILLSADSSFDVAMKAVNHGCDGLLQKPLPSIHALYHSIEHCCWRMQNLAHSLEARG